MAEILEAAGGLDPSQTVSLKTCSKCRETKPLGDFYRSPRYSSGQASRCKNCMKVAAYSSRFGKVRPWQEMLVSIGAP